MDERFSKILKCVPQRAAAAAIGFLRTVGRESVYVSEIRLRAGAPMSLTFCGRNISVFDGKSVICSETELSETLSRLCEDSVHSFEETMREGYLTVAQGVRVGVCGRVSVTDGTIRSVYGVTSLCVRVPNAVRGVCDAVLPYIRENEQIQSALFYAAPHVGKTTLIRDLAATLSYGPNARRVALVDTRGELAVGEVFGNCLADVLYAYPRGKGIEIATRTLSPEAIFCDEIGSPEEAQAILSAQNSGVPLIATAHASDREALLRRPAIQTLFCAGVFRYYIGLRRAEGSGRFRFSIFDTERGAETAV